MAIGADTLTAILAGLAAQLATVDDLTVYDYEPASVDALPAATIRLQEAQRQPLEIGVERGESQIGSVDLYLAWTIIVYVNGDYARDSDIAALELLGRLIGALDTTPDLGIPAVVLDSSVASATRDRVVATRDGRELLTYVVTFTTTSLHA